MREIKFRAWDKEDKRMYCDDKVIVTFSGFLEEVYVRRNSTVDELIDYKLMQYSGIKDIEGKEIYEGDIVEFLDEEVNYSHCGVEYDEFINIGKVIFSHDELMGWDITNRNMDLEEVWHYREYIKVIGNIYENPELLEGRF
ncbi:YopX family protein [Romboutsia ilealis]|uniref:YopX family protein n=1 Tax=Romboutsia ilealis TaxID=1115758 RepID=UPI0025745F02|nr:YopX family protein [Romboutsia ilealis]